MNETEIAGKMYQNGYTAGWDSVWNCPAPGGYSKYMAEHNWRCGFEDGVFEAIELKRKEENDE